MKSHAFYASFAFLLLLLILLALCSPLASAEGPQPWQYAMVKCSGLSIDDIVYGQGLYDTDYGWANNITTMDQWRATYQSRINGFAHSVGCADVFRDPGSWGPTHLTMFYRVYDATYQRIIERNLIP